MDLRFARRGDGIRQLWELCFRGDSGRIFFEREFDCSRCLVQTEENGSVVSMLNWTYRNLCLWDEEIKAAYILGIATHPIYRRQGLAGELIEQVFFELHLRKIPIAFLLPANAGLMPFYRKYGFRRAGISQAHIVCARIGGVLATDDDISFLSDKYKCMVGRYPHVVRERAQWEIIIREYDVIVNPDGYAVYDGNVCLERSGALLQEEESAACLRVIDAKWMMALAKKRGEMVPRTVYDDWCPWNDLGGKVSDGRLEDFYFAKERIYANLLYNGGSE